MEAAVFRSNTYTGDIIFDFSNQNRSGAADAAPLLLEGKILIVLFTRIGADSATVDGVCYLFCSVKTNKETSNRMLLPSDGAIKRWQKCFLGRDSCQDTGIYIRPR